MVLHRSSSSPHNYILLPLTLHVRFLISDSSDKILTGNSIAIDAQHLEMLIDSQHRSHITINHYFHYCLTLQRQSELELQKLLPFGVFSIIERWHLCRDILRLHSVLFCALFVISTLWKRGHKVTCNNPGLRTALCLHSMLLKHSLKEQNRGGTRALDCRKALMILMTPEFKNYNLLYPNALFFSLIYQSLSQGNWKNTIELISHCLPLKESTGADRGHGADIANSE